MTPTDRPSRLPSPSDTFLGLTCARWASSGLEIAELEYRGVRRLAPHAHQFPYFCFVIQGGYRESVGAIDRYHGPGALLFRPPGELHATRFIANSTRCLVIRILANWRHVLDRHPSLSSGPGRLLCGGEIAPLVGTIRREVMSKGTGVDLALEGSVLLLLAQAARGNAGDTPGNGPPPAWLGRVIELIHERFRDRLSLTELARAGGVHPSHLVRSFRAFVGCSVGAYLRRMRVEYAARRLTSTSMEISSIALDAGFSDQSHLCRVFRSLMGSSPREYRARGRSD